jgi:metal-sulfur cluster biosynthetic enzyme
VPGNPVAEQAVRNVLLGVMDPELGDNIVDLGMVRIIEIDPQSGDVDVTIAPTTAGCPLRAQIMKDIKLRVASLPRVAEVRVPFGAMTTEQKKNAMARARFQGARQRARHRHPATTRIVAIASGKGRSGQVVGHSQPGCAAGPAGPDGRCARRRHRRVLHPPHARRERWSPAPHGSFQSRRSAHPMPEPRPMATSQTRPKDNDKEPLPR